MDYCQPHDPSEPQPPPPSPTQETKLEQTKMEISNPRRILAVALSDSAQHLSNVIKSMRHHQNILSPHPVISSYPLHDLPSSHLHLPRHWLTHPALENRPNRHTPYSSTHTIPRGGRGRAPKSNRHNTTHYYHHHHHHLSSNNNLANPSSSSSSIPSSRTSPSTRNYPRRNNARPPAHHTLLHHLHPRLARPSRRGAIRVGRVLPRARGEGGAGCAWGGGGCFCFACFWLCFCFFF